MKQIRETATQKPQTRVELTVEQLKLVTGGTLAPALNNSCSKCGINAQTRLYNGRGYCSECYKKLS